MNTELKILAVAALIIAAATVYVLLEAWNRQRKGRR